MKRKDFLRNSALAAGGMLFPGSLAGAALSVTSGKGSQTKGYSYRYPTSYNDWPDAFLSGNGKMGIMVFGNPLQETIIYNDRGFNLAKTRDRSFPNVKKSTLDTIKRLCAEEKFKAADQLAVHSAHWQDGGEGSRHPGFKMEINIPEAGDISHYQRVCNFRTGEISVQWTDDRGDWERRAFVSRQDNVIVQQLAAPAGGRLNCSLELAVDPGMHFPEGMQFIRHSTADFLVLKAQYPEGTDGAGYEGVVRICVKEGRKRIKGHTLYISDVRRLLMLTKTQKYYHKSKKQWQKKRLQNKLQKTPADYHQLLKRHIAVHQPMYDRVTIDLQADAGERSKSNEALLNQQAGASMPVKALWERIFYAGRYYYLSSSSNETPPDLLGLWTGDCKAGWGGFYVLDANLNLQVGGGNIGAMPEAMEGYFNIVEDWYADFKINARKLLNCRGALSCGNTPGPTTGLMANINTYYPYQYATGEEGWVLYPFWEHYLVTGDVDFLRQRLYPMLKDMGGFYEDFLTLHDDQGNYIFAGSVSPENQPANIQCSLLNNSVFEISGARFILRTLIKTCQILGVEQGSGQGIERWTRLLDKLPPYLINNDGALQEWAWPGIKDHYDHRHSSQLLTVWPYQEITPEQTPKLFNAARKTLALKDQYNYENAGHGLLHAALIAAGLNNARSLEKKVMRLTGEGFYYDSLCSSHYNQHNVFCTDVCHTVPTVMMEMLIASSPGKLELLPAVPASLSTGSISGVKGRNRVTVQQLRWNLNRGQIHGRLLSEVDQELTIIARPVIHSLTAQVPVYSSPLGAQARRIRLRRARPRQSR